ncbi:hypothetical protein [Mycobacterium sp. DL592]|uniref:hypothetical protein n=1 Tax=Mycobacterium sp. DL592 TaxID=2675524 RepID=UPI00142435DD|nr:hypothetical protein [Mycobacterium sp. DL592]
MKSRDVSQLSAQSVDRRRRRSALPVLAWLRAGAVAAGVGAALSFGAGVAAAETPGADSGATAGAAKPDAAQHASSNRATGSPGRRAVASSRTAAAAVTTTAGPVTLAGVPVGVPQVALPGLRIYQTTTDFSSDTTKVAVIDPRTGAVVGTPVTVVGRVGQPVTLGVAGLRAFQVASGPSYDPNVSSQVVVVNSLTGGEVGSPLTIKGATSNPITLGALGLNGIVQTTYTNDSGTPINRFTVVSGLSGAQVGTPLDLAGGNGQVSVGALGLLAYVSTSDATTKQTRVAVINTLTGQEVGNPVVIDQGPSVFNGNTVGVGPLGLSAYQLTAATDANGMWTTTITRISGLTGQAIGTPVTAQGTNFGNPVVFGALGLRALVQTYDYDPATYTISGTHITVISTLTGTSSTVDIPGATNLSIQLGQFGLRAYSSTWLTDANGVRQTRTDVIDTLTGKVVGTPIVQPGLGTVYVAPGGLGVYETLRTGNTADSSTTIIRINPLTGAQMGRPITVAGSPQNSQMGSALFGLRSYQVTNGGTVVIDTLTGTVVGSPLSLAGVNNLYGVLAGPLQSRIIRTVAEQPNTATVTVIDALTGKVVGTPVTVSGNGYPLANPNDRYAYLAANFGTQITRIDTVTGQVAGDPIVIPSDRFGARLTLDPTGSYLYATSTDPNNAYQTLVTVIDTHAWQVV